MPVLWTLELMLDWAKKNGKKVNQENFNALMEEWIKETNKPFEEENEAQRQASFFMSKFCSWSDSVKLQFVKIV